TIARTSSGKDVLDAALRSERIEAAAPQILAFVFMKFITAILPRTLAVRADPTLVHRKRLDRQLTTASETLSKAMARLAVDTFEPGASGDPLMRRAATFYGGLARCSSALAKAAFGPDRHTISPQPVDVPDELERLAANIF